MKNKIIIIIVTVILIIALCVTSMYYTNTVKKAYTEKADKITAYVYQEKWAEAQLVLLDFSKQWDKQINFLQVWVIHDDTDEIVAAVKALEIGIMLRDKAMALPATAQLLQALEHLSGKDHFDLAHFL